MLTVWHALAGYVPQALARTETVQDWLIQEHQFLRRYLEVVRQAAHDYRYNYKTPELLMPVAIDLFTGYVVHIHQLQEQCIYPVARKRMTPAQLQIQSLMEHDQHVESETVQRWEHQLEAPDADLTKVAETIDYLGQMINRHLVFQENRLFPVLETLTPKDHATIVACLRQGQQRIFGTTGRRRYEAWLAYIEAQIKRIAGRVW